jgi:hypothetical protein
VSSALWRVRKLLGPTLADQVVYKALTEYFTPMTEFVDVAKYVGLAAQELGATLEQRQTMSTIFTQHGIVPNWDFNVAKIDGTKIIRGLSAYWPTFGVGGGRYAVSDLGRPPGAHLAIYTSTLGKLKTPARISPPSQLGHEVPATNGKTVLWAATQYSSFGRPVKTLIQSRSVSGGKVRTLRSYRNALIWATAMDDQVWAWEIATGRWSRIFVRRPDGRVVEVPRPRGASAEFPTVKGTQVVYALNSLRSSKLMSYDVRTGRTRTLDRVRGRLTWPVLTSKHVSYLSDTRRGPRAAIVRINRNGSGRQVFVAETSGSAPPYGTLTASDQYVTYAADLWENIYQFPTQGGDINRVSCSTGQKYLPTAVGGSHVVYIDVSAGRKDLVGKRTPNSRCN